MNLVKVNASEFGLEESKANEMVNGLMPILEERKVLAEQYAEIIREEFSEDQMNRAKKLRLLIVKNRTQGVEKWHRANKEFYLAGGRFVDAVKNKEIAENLRMEDTLSEIEKHFENLEKERIQKLKEERTALLSPFVDDLSGYDLGNMTEFIWNDLFEGAQLRHAKRIEDQKKAEEERIAREKKEEEEREAQRIENERLKKEAEDREIIRGARSAELRSYVVFIRDYNALLNLPEEDYQKEFDSIKKGAELQWEHDRKEMARQQKEAEDAKKKADEDAAARKKLEDELRQKKSDEEKAEADRLAALEAEANKGDAAKVKDLIADLASIGEKYSFKSKKNQQMYSEVRGLLNKVIAHIQK